MSDLQSNSDTDDTAQVITPVAFQPPREQGKARKLTIRVGVIASGLLLAALLLIALFVITSRSVTVKVEPETAEVKLSGGLIVKLGKRYLARPGSYPLSARAEGYHPLNEMLSVGRDHDQSFAFDLRPLPGHLMVEAGPAESVTIYLDGEEKGTAPLRLESLEPGEYQLKAQAERYLPAETAVTITGKGLEQNETLTLEPAWAQIAVTSTPAGASLLVDGEDRGQTPLSTEVLQGDRKLELKLDGHKNWRKKITVSAGEDQDLGSIELPLADATVKVITKPAGANITVDGEFRGLSPFTLSARPGQTLKLQAFKPGHNKNSKTHKVTRGDQTVRIDLNAQIGEVMVLALPEDADLFVDGKPAGKAVQILRLPARKHKIELRRSGYLPYSTTVTPRPGVQQRVEARLQTEAQARQAATRPIIRTAAGQEMKLFRPSGQFTMGAPRREPGRRANEVQRDVVLKRPFYLSTREVTNSEFKAFLASHVSGRSGVKSLDGPNQPAANMTWDEAASYCNWLSQREGLQPFYRMKGGQLDSVDQTANGYRLPTEAEWAFVARYDGKGGMRKFPWGTEMPPALNSGNYADISARETVGVIIRNYKDGYAASSPVSTFLANENGIYDMGGNVAEWVHDRYDIGLPVQGMTLQDPLGPSLGETHVIRGSSWAHSTVTDLRLSARAEGSEGREDVGFRIARYLD